MSSLLDRYQLFQKNISEVCQQSGRSSSDVQLMLVTKTVSIDRISETIRFGHKLFGENKVQELSEKHQVLSQDEIDFHFIGHLQTNKVKKCLECATMIHSVDRIELALELEKQLQRLGQTKDILVQVNTSNEESKFGVSPEGAMSLVQEISKLKTLKIKGLMTLAKFSSEENEVRPCFKLLKSLSDQIRDRAFDGVAMKELSMGMSSDYKIAIQEGATIVRIGTAIFGERKLPDSYYWPEDKN